MLERMHPETALIRSLLTPAVPGEPLHAGPVFATAFHTPGDPALAPYSYARSHNPTWTHLEQALAGLEHPQAQVRVFASGQAATGAVFAVTLRPGDVVVLAEDTYFGTGQLLREVYVPMGVQVRVVSDLLSPGALTGARLVWVETPSNPNLGITDVARVCEAAHAAGAVVAVDNTTATALLQQPLALGADFSVASDSKSPSGHSDLLLGHVAVRDLFWLERLDRYRNTAGPVLGPMEAWLALRSLATLPLRMERSAANAQVLAEFLAGRPEVAEVLYPGLPGHPGHAVAARQMRSFGAVVSFTLRSQAAAEQFLSRAQLLTEATSFGGVTTTAERRARWGHDRIAPGFIRLSVGCERVEDLQADLAQALDGLA